jgi:hypothetical protein
MRQECLAESIMIRRYKADQAFRRSPVIYPYVVGMLWRNSRGRPLAAFICRAMTARFPARPHQASVPARTYFLLC